jgi:OmpA-OmpF porin, OOP family
VVRAIVLASAALLAAPAFAQGFYAGGSIGQSDVDEEVAAGLIDSGSVDGKDTAFKIFGGYQFTPNLAAEAAYVDLGETTYSGTFGGAPVTGGKVEISGFNISAVGILPINEKFSAFGKIGIFIWEADASDTTGGAAFSASDDGSDLSFGLGASYAITPTLSLRAEWERFDSADADADLLSIGVAFRF